MELKIEKPGVLLEWEFRTEPKGIAFGIFYRRKEGSSQSEVSGGGGGGCSVWLGDEVWVISLCAYVQWVACYRHTHMYSALRLPLSSPVHHTRCSLRDVAHPTRPRSQGRLSHRSQARTSSTLTMAFQSKCAPVQCMYIMCATEALTLGA